MSDEYVEAPETSAQDADSDLSPSMTQDTQSTGSEGGVGTDEVAALRAELEELRKRVSHGSKTYQELQRERQSREALESRINSWRAAGIDPDEIDKAIESVAGTGNVQPRQQQQPEGMTKAQLDQYLQQRDMLRDWNYEKKAFFKSNPELDDAYFRRHMDAIAAEIANKEIAENGAILSTPEQVAAKAGRELLLMVNKLETKAQKRLSETREKVKSQNIVESPHVRSKGPADSDDPMDEARGQSYLRDLALSMHREHRRKIMSRGVE